MEFSLCAVGRLVSAGLNYLQFVRSPFGRALSRTLFTLGAIFALGLISISAHAGTHAAGNSPSNGQTIWHVGNGSDYACDQCHSTNFASGPPYTPYPPTNSNLGSAFAASYGAICDPSCPNKTLAYYATNPGNITSSMQAVGSTTIYPSASGDMTATHTNQALNNQNDVSAYFASLMTPSIANPGATTVSAGAAYSYQIVASAATSDYLVSTTTYNATNLPTGVTRTGDTISGNVPTSSAPSTYSITLSATNSAASPTTGSATFTLTVKGTQTITLGAAPTVAYGGTGTVTVTGSGGSGNAVTFSSANTAQCTVNSSTGVVTGVTVGTGNCTINANQALSATYDAAPQASRTFDIVKANQTINFGTAPTMTYGGATGTVSATATSGLGITSYSIPVTTSVCSISGTTVTALSAGTCIVQADQAGNGNYNSATQTQSITISKANQTVNFGTAPSMTYGGATGTVSATATSGLGITSYTIPVTTSVCSISGATVTSITAGTCTVQASQAGDGNYNSATQTQNITINQAAQTISFGTAPTVLVGATGNVSATGGGSGNTVTFSIPVTTSICSISGTTVTGIAAGTCIVQASQAGNSNYLAGSQTQNIAVGLNPQSIVFGTAPSMTYGGGTATVSASGGASGNPVVFSVPVTTSVCSVSGNVVTALSAGTCTVAANQAGNGTYAAASPVTQDITISKANQSISFGTAPSVVVGGTGAVTASATSGLTVTLSSTTSGTCSISGGTVTGLNVGTCTISAVQTGNGNYNAATTVTQSFSIGQGGQTISFGAAPTIVVGGTGSVSATATSTLAVSLTSTTTGICTISGTTVTGVTAGTCTIAANQAGNANYTAATQVTQNITIGKGGQTVSFGTAPSIVVGGTGSVSATSTSGLAVALTSTTTSICTISGNTVTGVGVGSCIIAGNQSGNANYNAATQVTQSFTIGQGSQTITFGTAPSITVGGTGTVSATTTSGLAVTLASTTTGICTISGNTVTGVAAGTCTIAADQAGNANYAAATQVTQSFAVSNLPPTVSAASMSTTLNQAKTLDLSPFITGTGVTGVSIATQPAHGSVSTSGTKVTYTPAKDYFGTDSFAYQAYGAVGISAGSATVTVTITGRPNPLKDPRVTGMVNIETASIIRFGKAQLSNFQQRLESRHHAGYNGAAAASLNIRDSNIPPAGDATSAQNRAYFNSWQPGTVLTYANDPNVLLHTPDRPQGRKDIAYNPMLGSLMDVVTGALSNSTLNLTSISNAAGAMQQNEEFDRLEVWAAGNLRFGTRSQEGTETVFSTDGVSVGVDKRFDRKLTAGIGIGYARDNSSIGTDGTNSVANGNSMAAYASYQSDAGTFLDGLLGYGKVNFDTNRYVTSVSDFARATRRGDQIFGSLTFGYEYRKEGLLWSPYGRYDFSYNRLNEGTETGAGSNALTYAQQIAHTSQIALGLRAQSAHQTEFGLVQPHVRFEYQHGFETTGQTSVAYADLPGVQYSVPGATQNSNSIVLGLGSDFLLSDTLRFMLDYQRLRSGISENSQSITFKLTKTLKGKNDLAGLLEESYSTSIAHPTGLLVAAGFAYDDNVSRASDALDKLSDTIYSLTLSKAFSSNVSEHTRLSVSGFVDIEKFRTYAGLGHTSGGVQGEFAYRPSGEFGSPIFGILERLSADQYESKLRDGSHRTTEVNVRKPLTDRINLFVAVAENVRIGRSDVFNTYDISGRMNLDYALAADKTLYLTGEYRKGDIVSSGQPSLKIMDVSYVFVRDDVFNAPAFFDYRMKGRTTLWTLGYNQSLGTKDSLDFSWRRVQSHPDKAPAFGSAIHYIDNLFSISYLMAF